MDRITDMTFLDRLTRFHGRLSDLRAVWFPFLFLKPASSEVPITWKRLSAMIPCFGGWLFLGWMIRERIVGDSHSPAVIAKTLVYMMIGFAIWFNVVTAPLWNRRIRMNQAENSALPEPANPS